MTRFLWIFISVFLFIAFFRFFSLGTTPNGLTKDEAYYGYDAYSILKTGKDIWGVSYPLRFKSTGEYKLNLTYLVIPAIKLFDLSELAVRLPSAIFGFLTLIILFFTLRQFKISSCLSLIFVTIFAFSPWSFGMSRLFYESNVGLFFIAFGLYGLVRQQRGQTRFWEIAAPISLALSAYLYGPYLYIGFVMLLFYAIMKKSWRLLLLFIITLIPLLSNLSSGGALTRLSQEWQLKLPGISMEINEARANCLLSFSGNTNLAKICYPLWNKPVLIFKEIFLTAARQLSPEYLFFSGVNSYITPKDTGAYPISLFPLYFLGIVGLYDFVRRDKQLFTQMTLLILSLLSSVLIVSLAGRVEIYRNPVGLYLLFICTCVGVNHAYNLFHNQSKNIALFTGILFLLIIYFDQSRYLMAYFTNYTNNNPLTFSSDSKELYDYLNQHRSYNYLIDLKFHGPIYGAFYWKLDPNYFRDNVSWTDPDPWGWINAKSVGNIYSTETTVNTLLCRKQNSPSQDIKALVISDPIPIYSDFASYTSYDFSHSLRLHDIYDIDYLYSKLKVGSACK